MTQWTIGRKLFSAVGALVVLLMIGSGVALWGTAAINQHLDETGNRTAKRLKLALEMQRDLEEAYSSEKSALLAAYGKNAASVRQQSEKAVAAMDTAKQHAGALVPLLQTDSGRQAMARVGEGFDTWRSEHRELLALAGAGQLAEALQRFEESGRELRKRTRADLEVVVNNQDQFLVEKIRLGAALYANVWYVLLAVAGLSLLVAGGVAVIVRGVNGTLRGITAELAQGAEQVASASGQVATASQSLSQGATEQAASLEETSASMEEMASMTRRNAQNAGEAAAMMIESERLIRDANVALDQMVSSMTAIKDSSDKVAKIIKTIDEIAFQTNILALNAAVEAARAGDAGMGFAVVADEVRALAQRSAQAAKDTAALIEESIARSAEGHDRVRQVTAAINSVTEASLRIKGLVDEVSTASQQQSQGIDQVSQAVAQMEKVTQGTAATAEESAAASEELNAQAETSMMAVGKLGALVGGARLSEPRQPRVAREPRAVAAADRKVVTLRPARKVTAEDAIPLESAGTGTYGSF